MVASGKHSGVRIAKIQVSTIPAVAGDTRQQDVRARALDENFDAERRQMGERVAVMFRWIFLAVLGALINLTSVTSLQAKDTVDIVLGVWALMALFVTILLFRGYRPGKQFSLTTMTLDILFSAALVYLSDGFNSPYFLALFLSVITNAVRFGATASVVSAVAIAVIYLFVGGSFTPPTVSTDPNARVSSFGIVFLFLVVALATGYMTRELERERRQAVRRIAQADLLREMSASIVAETDIKDVFAAVAGNALEMSGALQGDMVLAAPDGFSVVATRIRPGVAAAGATPIDDTQLAHAARSGEAAFSADRTTMVIPMASSDGITVLLNLNRPEQPFSNQDLFAVDALSGGSAVALANALRYHRSTQEANTDSLTGLYNVRELRRRLDAALARPDRATSSISLLLIDFDHFKSVNDDLGHQHGDLVLQMGARIVRSAARAQDAVARYGGDELAIMAIDTSGIGAQRLAYRIVDAVHAAAVITTPGKNLTFSIGVATYPEDALSASELIAAADQALYLAKREGKDRACTFPQLVTELELADGNLMTMLADAGPQVVVAAAHAVDHRSPVTQGHSSRVAAIVESLARLMGVSGPELENLRTAAFLHDIGHMGLIVDGQEAEMPGHEAEGERIVAGAKFSEEVSGAVRHHHERWDGQGKPDGLAGDAIPRPARILALAEAYEALTAGRGCERVTPAAALENLKLGSGTWFDPRVIDALTRNVSEGGLEPPLPALALPAVAVATPAAVPAAVS
jgi:diguanylate cyclase (GGDEF)-like protein/putative nucleotidyltransferase with HDIG domain